MQPRRFEDCIDDALLRFVREGRPAREAESATEYVSRDCAAHHATVSMHGLQVHRFPDGACFDVPGLQVLANLSGPDSETDFVEQYTR